MIPLLSATFFERASYCFSLLHRKDRVVASQPTHLLNNPIISAFASVLKCKLNPTTAADVSPFTSSLSVFTAVDDLEREADLEYFDRVELKFRVQAALDVSGLTKAVLLARKQKVTN
jgi:hypothetical protein